MDVVEGAVEVDRAAERSLVPEPDPLVETPCTLVEVEHVELNALQPKLVEPEADQGAEGIAAIALAGIGRIPDQDPQTCAAVAEIDLVEIETPTGRSSARRQTTKCQRSLPWCSSI